MLQTDSAFQNPTNAEIRALLAHARTIAVVGLSPQPDRPSHAVAIQLQRFGYRIVPIRPGVAGILGARAYPDLHAACSDPAVGAIDIVDVFRAPEHVDAIVDACVALRLPVLWLQDGVVNRPAARRAQRAGMMVVMDRCVYRDRVALLGSAPVQGADDR